jgi:GT2 family glycosyltransferase
MEPSGPHLAAASNSRQPDLSIVIVSWNVRTFLRNCLDSILQAATVDTAATPQPTSPQPNRQLPSAEVIVVDNASNDGSVEMLRGEYPWATVLVNSDNLGFTRANNQGLALARGRYLLFLNPDTEVSPEALGLMVAYADAHAPVGIVGPQLLYEDGSHQSSRRRFPTLATFFVESTILQRWWPHNSILQRYYVLDRPDDAVSQVDWVVGACMLVRRAVLDQVGAFDEGFFMYSEEMDLCRRAVEAGWQVVYLPEAVVRHYEGKSSQQVVAARHIRFFTSRVRYAHKVHGPWAATALRVFLLATFAFQWAEEGGKWLVGHAMPDQRPKLSMRRERMNAYRQVLRSGLRPDGLSG